MNGKIVVVASDIRNFDDSVEDKQITGISKVLGDIYYAESIKEEILFLSTIVSDCSYNVVFDTTTVRKFSKLDVIKTLKISGLIETFLIYWKRRIAHEWLAIKTIMACLAFLRFIESVKPPIIHFHDLTEPNLYLLKALLDKRCKCILTLHIYMGKQNNLKSYEMLQKREEQFFSAHYDNLHITGVSANIKNRLLSDHPHIEPNTVTTISNGTNYIGTYNIEVDEHKAKFTFLCIGDFCERKNQAITIKALSEMAREDRDRMRVVFAGIREETFSSFKTLCQKYDVTQSVELLGVLSTEALQQQYSKADVLISTSLNESFGLTFVEGFSYGLPSIAFKDIDAIEELYDKDAMLLIENHSSTEVAQILLEAMHRTWDREKILSHAKKFSVETMVNGYIGLYEALVERNSL